MRISKINGKTGFVGDASVTCSLLAHDSVHCISHPADANFHSGLQDYTEVFVKKSVETKVLQLAQDIGMIISLL